MFVRLDTDKNYQTISIVDTEFVQEIILPTDDSYSTNKIISEIVAIYENKSIPISGLDLISIIRYAYLGMPPTNHSYNIGVGQWMID